jgi:DedD protein
MKFLLVLSDAFDALWALRGRVALALVGVAVLGALVAIYLPLIAGDERASPQPVTARNPVAQGTVERARAVPQAAAPVRPQPMTSPETASAAAPAPAPASEPRPAPATTTASAAQASSAPEIARPREPAAAPDSAPASAPSATEPVFLVQVGAFREAERAQRLAQRMTRAGFPTSVVRGTTSDGARIFRVRTRQALPDGEARQLVARMRRRIPALRPFLVRGEAEAEAAG